MTVMEKSMATDPITHLRRSTYADYITLVESGRLNLTDEDTFHRLLQHAHSSGICSVVNIQSVSTPTSSRATIYRWLRAENAPPVHARENIIHHTVKIARAKLAQLA
ncbi:MAG: hypothetical protein WAX89_03580 [Alphaproteobacteria bacterium]